MYKIDFEFEFQIKLEIELNLVIKHNQFNESVKWNKWKNIKYKIWTLYLPLDAKWFQGIF